ncbi:aldolase/citrate lyase family protein [Sphingobium sp. Sx8-8]|uniref:HpcH/HpaI aldolase family protein n=1 Tax=Sphingobium sp. Sx8-8 TaxID=2933617 RepID=UPI001F59ECDC|nr:aldolase/citrate lyase family protein [Sphingobium sp. Sx8-8]
MPLMQARNRLNAMIGRGEQPFGIFISSLDAASTDIMADAGFDFVMLDGEHGRLDRIAVEQHVRAARAGGILSFVRILDNVPTLIQSMLDVGADGVMVPHIDTADQARAAVEASRYAPRGRRGMCPACLAGRYTLEGWTEHVHASDENAMVIPILESRRAIENVADILAVDGIDLVMFGPGDLSADMAIDFSRDGHRMEAAWRCTLDAARTAGKLVMAPAGFTYDEADILLVEMELMLLRKTVGGMVADHRATQAARGALK